MRAWRKRSAPCSRQQDKHLPAKVWNLTELGFTTNIQAEFTAWTLVLTLKTESNNLNMFVNDLLRYDVRFSIVGQYEQVS